jgi:hypothetical protein
MPASIYCNLEGQAEIFRLYDEALSHLGIGPRARQSRPATARPTSSPRATKTPRRSCFSTVAAFYARCPRRQDFTILPHPRPEKLRALAPTPRARPRGRSARPPVSF